MCMDCFQGSVHKSHRYKVGVHVNVNTFNVVMYGTNGYIGNILLFLFFMEELFSIMHFNYKRACKCILELFLFLHCK